MSYRARIVETGQELPCSAGSMGLVNRKLVVEVQPGQHIEIEYRPDEEEEMPKLHVVWQPPDSLEPHRLSPSRSGSAT